MTDCSDYGHISDTINGRARPERIVSYGVGGEKHGENFHFEKLTSNAYWRENKSIMQVF
jgi:hypothetical protein